ncbi:hypothetical protein Pfo_012744 [Paulownia fortunei]|nr:hypothetical protein Pfo_012744 [Paulownia fortunei]
MTLSTPSTALFIPLYQGMYRFVLLGAKATNLSPHNFTFGAISQSYNLKSAHSKTTTTRQWELPNRERAREGKRGRLKTLKPLWAFSLSLTLFSILSGVEKIFLFPKQFDLLLFNRGLFFCGLVNEGIRSRGFVCCNVSLRPIVMVAENQAKILTCSTMSAEDNTVPRKLKFKITTKGIRDDSEDKLPENIVKVIVNNGQRDRVTGGGKRSEVNVLVKPSMPANSTKRRPEMSLDGQRGKKRKMGRNLKLQCGSILKELMNHPVGCIFSEPVDPVKLEIPDYFSIITEPMDLGTIKRKLECNMYFGAEEFAADVRLTFSNAMLYNPPGHEVHNWAKRLDGNFSRRWKSLEAKLKDWNKNVDEASFVDYMENNGQDIKQTVENNHQDTKPVGLNKAPLRVKVGTYRPMSIEEKRKFRLELVQVLSRKVIENLRTVFQKFGLSGLRKERLDSYIDSTDDETLWKLRREIKVFLDARDDKVKPARIALNGCPSLRKTVQKEHCSQSACASANHRQSIDSAEAKCSSCVSLTCHCRLKNGSAQASTSDISSERSSEHDHCGDSKLDCEVKYPLAFHTTRPGIVLNEENSPHLSTPASTAASVEGWTSLNVQISPKKALRAAMLKSRFADTIFRATHQALLDHGEKSDRLRMQQERKRLEREQLEEKARIEAEIKAAEAASRRREQDDLKMRRERERAAARMAVQQMEKTVDIDENVDILKDLEILCCGSLTDLPDGEGCEGFKGVHPGNPLERLGLYMKDDYLEEDEDAILTGEEGEILKEGKIKQLLFKSV